MCVVYVVILLLWCHHKEKKCNSIGMSQTYDLNVSNWLKNVIFNRQTDRQTKDRQTDKQTDICSTQFSATKLASDSLHCSLSSVIRLFF